MDTARAPMESTADPVLFIAGNEDEGGKMKRREPMVRVSKISDRVILTLAVLTIAGFSLPGCKVESGGSSGGGTVLGYSLHIEEEPEGFEHSHVFFITTFEIDNKETIMRDTERGPNHEHSLIVTGTQLATFGNDGSLITGRTGFIDATPIPDHDHAWGLEL